MLLTLGTMLDILRRVPRVAFRASNKNCGQKKSVFLEDFHIRLCRTVCKNHHVFQRRPLKLHGWKFVAGPMRQKSAPTWPDHPMSARGGIDQHAASTRQEGEPFTSHHKRGRCPLAFDRCDPAEICLSRHCESSATTATATRHSERIFSFGEF